MAPTAQRPERRTDALTKDRIVDAAIGLLDAGGSSALTFRQLAARLATGPGAIYHHVANKDELLAAAADSVISPALAATTPGSDTPQQTIRAVALIIFDSIDTHPWIGTQLLTAPAQSAMSQIIESFGGPVRSLGVPESALFDSVFTLVNYVLGVAVQNAGNARLHAHGVDRSTTLTSVAERWAELDDAQFPFLTHVASQLPTHDDREQFLFGIDLFLTGMGGRCI